MIRKMVYQHGRSSESVRMPTQAGTYLRKLRPLMYLASGCISLWAEVRDGQAQFTSELDPEIRMSE